MRLVVLLLCLGAALGAASKQVPKSFGRKEGNEVLLNEAEVEEQKRKDAPSEFRVGDRVAVLPKHGWENFSKRADIKVAGPPDARGHLKIQYGDPVVTLSIHRSLLRPMTAKEVEKLQGPSKPEPDSKPLAFPDGAKDPVQLAWIKEMREWPISKWLDSECSASRDSMSLPYSL